MRVVKRLDLIKLDAIEITSQGFMRFPVFAGRTGIQIYQGEDGAIKRELRPSEEVFSQETMDTLRNIPVTNEHPEEMINLDNANGLMVGMGADSVSIVNEDGEEISGADPSGKFQKTFVTITDKNAIRDIQEGKIEVSLGYDVELDETPGVTKDGKEFDAIQRKIRNNHLALTDKGRAGPDVRLRFDRFDAIMIDETHNNNKKPEGNMAKLKIGDVEFEVEQEIKDAVEGEMAKLKKSYDELGEEKKAAEDQFEEEKKKSEDQMHEEKKKSEDQLEEEKKKGDSLQAKYDTLKESKGHRLDSAEIQKLVKERKDLEAVAGRVLDEDIFKKIDSMSNEAVKKEVIKNSTKADIKLDEKTSSYIDARFDAIKENLDTSDNENRDFSNNFRNRNDNNDQPDWRKKQSESMKNDSERWQKPIGKTASK